VLRCVCWTASLLFIGARERGVQRRLCAVAIRQSNEDSGPRSAAPSGRPSGHVEPLAETVEGGESWGNAEAAKIGAGDV
jgi:hypothetical protein